MGAGARGGGRSWRRRNHRRRGCSHCQASFRGQRLRSVERASFARWRTRQGIGCRGRGRKMIVGGCRRRTGGDRGRVNSVGDVGVHSAGHEIERRRKGGTKNGNECWESAPLAIPDSSATQGSRWGEANRGPSQNNAEVSRAVARGRNRNGELFRFESSWMFRPEATASKA